MPSNTNNDFGADAGKGSRWLLGELTEGASEDDLINMWCIAGEWIVRRKGGRNWVLRRFQQLRSYRDEIETWNREEMHYSSRILVVPRGLSVAEGT